MSSELVIRRAIVRALRERGCWVVVTTGVSLVGCPDLLVCTPEGKFLAPEVKVPGRYPKPIQRKVMRDIRNAGGIAVVVRSVDDALALL